MKFETRTFKKGDIVYRQNDYETCLYEVLYGGVTLYQNYGTKNQVLIKEIGPNSFLGEMEVIEARPRTTTAVATEKTEVKVISNEDFGALFTEKPALVMSMMQQMSARIRELTRLYNDACRVVSEAVDAEEQGCEKSEKLQSERKTLSQIYHAYLEVSNGRDD
ncbi:MAG: cyclic nucleotide-binding domain-containing protein [Ruminococcaceae bacterium]|jgi:CRP-like cAMP-binding protein|nr:cyclic nucleotide-binding domain-containing protein [Oscillospiraceae bacterium]